MSRCSARCASRRATELSTPPDNNTAIFTSAFALSRVNRASLRMLKVSRGGRRRSDCSSAHSSDWTVENHFAILTSKQRNFYANTFERHRQRHAIHQGPRRGREERQRP